MTNEEITKYIFLNNEDLRGDIAFVFGTWNAWRGSVEKAVELYQAGLVPKIIFSGGINKKTGITEGPAMAEEAVKLGVPRENILIEDGSTNTLENVLFSLTLMGKEIGLQNIHAIIGVVKNYHARRALMTLRRHVPMHVLLKAAAYTSDYYPFTKENWLQSDLGKEKVLEELRKIEVYLAKGDLAEL